MQLPPCMHGLLLHSFVSISQLRPSNPEMRSPTVIETKTSSAQKRCFTHLASIHRCSYPGSPSRWRCWSRDQSGTVSVASHSVGRWMLCVSSHSCTYTATHFVNISVNKFLNTSSNVYIHFICKNSLIHGVNTQCPVLAWLLLAFVSVDFTSLSLETGMADAPKASGVVNTSATVKTRLWLTLIYLDLTSGPCEHHQSHTDVRAQVSPAAKAESRGWKLSKAFRLGWLWSWVSFLCHSKASLSAAGLNKQCSSCIQYPRSIYAPVKKGWWSEWSFWWEHHIMHARVAKKQLLTDTLVYFDQYLCNRENKAMI